MTLSQLSTYLATPTIISATFIVWLPIHKTATKTPMKILTYKCLTQNMLSCMDKTISRHNMHFKLYWIYTKIYYSMSTFVSINAFENTHKFYIKKIREERDKRGNHKRQEIIFKSCTSVFSNYSLKFLVVHCLFFLRSKVWFSNSSNPVFQCSRFFKMWGFCTEWALHIVATELCVLFLCCLLEWQGTEERYRQSTSDWLICAKKEYGIRTAMGRQAKSYCLTKAALYVGNNDLQPLNSHSSEP